MKMMLIAFLFFLSLNLYASIWDEMGEDERRSAQIGQRDGGKFDIRLRVVDVNGNPVKDVHCGGWAFRGSVKDLGEEYHLLTDANGMVRIAGTCCEWVSVVLRKNEYYTTSFKVSYPYQAHPAIEEGKWQPYGEVRTVVLRKIVNPVPMTKPKAHYCEKVPYGQWHGFDIVCGDWMPPYGKGEHEDVIMRHNIEAVNNMNNFRTTLEVCFTNSPYAGVYRKMKDKQSDFNVEYHANTNAVYTKELSFVYEKRPHKPTIDTRVGADEYLVFRIRTKEDAEGRLISAQYGKILGPWTFFDAVSSAGIYVNPTLNDTNLEDEEGVRRARRSYKQFLEREERRKRNANR